MDLLLSKVYVSLELDESNVVVQVSWVVFRVDDDADDILLYVGVEFRFTIDIPLSQTNSQVSRSVSNHKR